MSRVKFASNDFSGGVAGRFGQKAIKENRYLEDALNVVPNHAGTLRPRPRASATPLELLPTDKYLNFVFRGRTFHVVYDPLCKRKFVRSSLFDLPADTPEPAGWPFATTGDAPAYHNISKGSDLLETAIERGLVQRDNTANRTFTDPEPPFAGDSFLTQAVAGYLGVRPDSELDGYIAALEAGAREYNAAHFSNLDASKRLYYTDSGEPGDITFSENDVGFTPGSKTGTGYAVMRSLEKAFSELNPDPKFDSYRWQRFTIYNDEYKPLTKYIVRPALCDSDSGEPDALPNETFYYDRSLFSGGVPKAAPATKAAARMRKWGVSPHSYSVSVGAAHVVFYSPEGVLPLMLWRPSSPDLIPYIVDMRAYYHSRSLGRAVYMDYRHEQDAEPFLAPLREKRPRTPGYVAPGDIDSEAATIYGEMKKALSYFGRPDDSGLTDTEKNMLDDRQSMDGLDSRPYNSPFFPGLDNLLNFSGEEQTSLVDKDSQTAKAAPGLNYTLLGYRSAQATPTTPVVYTRAGFMEAVATQNDNNYPVNISFNSGGAPQFIYAIGRKQIHDGFLQYFPRWFQGTYLVKGFADDSAENLSNAQEVAVSAPGTRARFIPSGYASGAAVLRLASNDDQIFSPNIEFLDKYLSPSVGIRQGDFFRAVAQGAQRTVLGFPGSLRARLYSSDQESLRFNGVNTLSWNAGYKIARAATLGFGVFISTIKGIEGLWLDFDEVTAQFRIGTDRLSFALTELKANGRVVGTGNPPASRSAGQRVFANNYILGADGKSLYYARQSRDYQAFRYIPMTDLIRSDYIKSGRIGEMQFDGSGWGVVECAGSLMFALVDNRRDELGWFPLDFGDAKPLGRFGVAEGVLYAADAGGKLVSWSPEADAPGVDGAWVRFLKPSTIKAQIGSMETTGDPVYSDAHVTGSFETVSGMQADGTRGSPISRHKEDIFRIDSPNAPGGPVTGVYLSPGGYLTGFEAFVSL